MRVLLANKFYYNRGGDCIVSLAVEQLLKKHGHQVAFFSMEHPSNFPSKWEGYFPSTVDFTQGNLKNKTKAVQRIFHSSEVKKKFSLLINNFKPDIVHLNNIHSQLSPIIGELAHQKGIKVIWTLHDYKLICPTYSCLRNQKTCELCIKGNSFNVLSKKCMKNSILASSLAFFESIVWNKKRLINNTDYFIAPSLFMKNMMVKGDFPLEKIKFIPNFTNRPFPDHIAKKDNYYCYVGRLSEEKGIQTLINVANLLPYKLIVIGTGPLKHLTYNKKNIQFVGFKEWYEMRPIIEQAKFIVVPSEWYEVFGLVSIEAQCLGTPVLGANIGGIPETISPMKSGLLFEAGNEDDLTNKIHQMFSMDFSYNDISSQARATFSAENYYNQLMQIYK